MDPIRLQVGGSDRELSESFGTGRPMDEQRSRRALGRRLGEGATILFSILLAFGIDAWWAEREAHLEVADYLAAVSTEMSANLDVLRADSARLARSRSAQAGVLSLTGPTPAGVGRDSLALLIGAAFDGVPNTLTTGAIDSFLGSEAFSRVPDVRLQTDLANWKGSYESLRNQSVVYQQGRTAMIEVVGGALPLLDAAHLVSPSLPRSSFPLDDATTLADPRLEGLMANLAALSARLGRDLDRLIALSREFLDSSGGSRGPEAFRG
ncbi:MAG TPA: hypothetical protein VK858_07275 [Longimicrobiales bacterium]|nr:hypothetical protein [Longimicrobiales bacterium]